MFSVMGRPKIGLAGQRFGRLEVIREAGRDMGGQVLWECRCDCGNVRTIRGNSLRQHTRSCGRLAKEMLAASRKVDILGRRYGRLTVICEAGRSKGKELLWRCRCDCGNVRVVWGTSLCSGNTRSCGCLAREMSAARTGALATKHGMSYTPESHALRGAKYRCTNPHHKQYKDWGGRGIKYLLPPVDEVVAVIGRRPAGLTLDRINNDGNYELGNIRWADRSTQRRNQRPRKRKPDEPIRKPPQPETFTLFAQAELINSL
jgi:hypothetical protein